MMKNFYVTCVLTSLFLLTGCLVGPDYERPVFFSDARLESALDLKPTPQMPIISIDFEDKTLRYLIETSYRQAPTIRLALVRLRQARQRVRIAAASLGPTINATALRQFEKESPNMETLVKEDYYQLGLDVSWELDIWGGTRRRVEAAQANVTGAVESLKNVAVSLAAEVANTYVNLRMNQELLKKAKENLSIQENMYQLTADLYETGLSNAIDTNQAKYQVESIRANIPQLEYQIASAQNALAALLGMLPQELNTLLAAEPENLVAKSFHYPIETLNRLPVSVVRNRPDVRVAEQNLIAQNAAVGAAIAALYPAVSVSSFFGFESLHADNLLNHRSYGYTLTPSVTQPLFHFGALKNNVALQKDINEEYLVMYEQQLLQAAQEIQTAFVAVDREKKSNTSYRRSYGRISEAAALNRNKYQNGLVSFETVLNSEQRRIQAQTQLIQSNAALYQNIIQFYKSIGGNAAYLSVQ